MTITRKALTLIAAAATIASPVAAGASAATPKKKCSAVKREFFPRECKL